MFELFFVFSFVLGFRGSSLVFISYYYFNGTLYSDLLGRGFLIVYRMAVEEFSSRRLQ